MFSLNSVLVAPGVRSALAVACGVVSCLPVAAWSAGNEMAPVVVTATRGTARISNLVADVTVIDSARLAAAAGQSLLSLLAEEPGLQFASNGGLGKSGSVYIRGGESRHTLLLVDGVRYGSATLGQPLLENLPVALIERIEIVRGPMSSLYGSDAAAGVIQVFTKRGKSGLSPYGAVTVGTDSFLQANAGLSGGTDAVTFNAGAQYQYSQGGSASNPRASFGNFNPDRDGFVQRSATLSAAIKLTPNWKLDGSWMGSKGVSHFDDGISVSDPWLQARSRLETAVGSLSLRGQLIEGWSTGVKLSSSEDISDAFEAVNDWNIGRYTTRQDQVAWENHVSSGVGEWLVAVEKNRQSVKATAFEYEKRRRDLDALVLGLSGDAGPHVWQLSVRRDENSQFGGENTGSAAYGYAFAPDWRVGASIGTSFVAPSFNQLYYPDYGNPALLPERGVNRELSVRWARGRDSFRSAYFDNRIRSFIDPGTDGGNISRVQMSGVSLSAETSVDMGWGQLGLGGSYDWLNAEDRATGRKLQLRAEHTVGLRASLTQGAWTHGVRWKGRDGAFTDQANTEAGRIAGYGLLTVSTQWAVAKDWRLGARIDNVTDRSVELQKGYNQPGRQFMLTVSYTPSFR